MQVLVFITIFALYDDINCIKVVLAEKKKQGNLDWRQVSQAVSQAVS